jgi:RNA polymerase sigma factor (sigma-70 family)
MRRRAENKPITLEEEQMLLAQIAAGNERARERLLLSVSGYIMREANLCKLSEGLTREDLYQAGMVGACRALAKFKPALGNRFGTYAIHWIRAEIWALQGANRTQLSGTALRGRRSDARKRDIQTLPLDLFDQAEEHSNRHVPDALTVDSTAEDEQELAEAVALTHELLKAAELTADERWVLEQRWLQPNRAARGTRDTERTLAALGKARGLTRERIRQIEANAFRKIREVAKP